MKITGCFFAFLALICSSFASYLEYDGWINIELEHALDGSKPDKFTFRGNITIPSLNVGIANAVQNPLNSEERNLLRKLAQDNKFYRLKSIIMYANGNKDTLLTSSRACSLANSHLSDILWVYVDISGSILGVSQSVSADIIDCEDSVLPLADSLAEFNTDVFVKHTELAPVPDTTSFIQKLEREREARDRGDVRDNRGFFAKYWMYIIPVVLLVLISGATNPEAQAGGR